MSECISMEPFAQRSRYSLSEVLQEAKDFPIHGTQTYGDGKAQYEEEEEGTYFHLKELKEHLKTLPSDERHKVKGFERLRNLDNGQDPNEGNNESDTVI